MIDTQELNLIVKSEIFWIKARFTGALVISKIFIAWILHHESDSFDYWNFLPWPSFCCKRIMPSRDCYEGIYFIQVLEALVWNQVRNNFSDSKRHQNFWLLQDVTVQLTKLSPWREAAVIWTWPLGQTKPLQSVLAPWPRKENLLISTLL